MQPAWHSVNAEWPLSRVTPNGEALWTMLGHMGPNGFLLIVVALLWWAQGINADSPEQVDQFSGALTQRAITQTVKIQLSLRRLSQPSKNLLGCRVVDLMATYNELHQNIAWAFL